jgi:hypothetical protein
MKILKNAYIYFSPLICHGAQVCKMLKNYTKKYSPSRFTNICPLKQVFGDPLKLSNNLQNQRLLIQVNLLQIFVMNHKSVLNILFRIVHSLHVWSPGFHCEHIFKSRYPTANINRINEQVATDTFFWDTEAHCDGILDHSGATMVLLYCVYHSQVTDA